MDWSLAIERNREALLRIVAMLLAMAGLEPGGDAGTLPRQLRARLLRILRPAEAATRRLIIVAAMGMTVTLRIAKDRGPAPSASPGPRGKDPAAPSRAHPAASFPVVDPLPRFDHRPFQRRPMSFPRITLLGREPTPIPDGWIARPDDLLSAAGLSRRLSALLRVLNEIDRHAARVARWRARRDLGLNRTRRFSPMRPGRPPGHRARPGHAVDEILRECHWLARRALAPDTS
ncbi:hypothetical protein [Oricola sp.]|uniref:hypothetical protein n=1 Tax=Oricola sp. TaxID=1979950 RepID=UPI0025D666B8|nr:hypothetical protein [Oricola sp.]MCI5073910.1 hypothetical protein [Oricola sp.]